MRRFGAADTEAGVDRVAQAVLGAGWRSSRYDFMTARLGAVKIEGGRFVFQHDEDADEYNRPLAEHRVLDDRQEEALTRMLALQQKANTALGDLARRVAARP